MEERRTPHNLALLFAERARFVLSAVSVPREYREVCRGCTARCASTHEGMAGAFFCMAYGISRPNNRSSAQTVAGKSHSGGAGGVVRDMHGMTRCITHHAVVISAFSGAQKGVAHLISGLVIRAKAPSVLQVMRLLPGVYSSDSS